MKWVVVLLCSFIINASAEKHLNANGPFRKYHTIDSEPNRRFCKRPPSIGSSSMPVTVATLNISTTVYSNKEQIIITWTSLPTSCQDDFIGIYFVEISLVACKHNQFFF